MADKLYIWTVYDHPLEYPDAFIARKFRIDADPVPTTHVLTCTSLMPIREALAAQGLTCIPRSPGDDPFIVESWL